MELSTKIDGVLIVSLTPYFLEKGNFWLAPLEVCRSSIAFNYRIDRPLFLLPHQCPA